jgi:hypothetical protein
MHNNSLPALSPVKSMSITYFNRHKGKSGAAPNNPQPSSSNHSMFEDFEPTQHNIVAPKPSASANLAQPSNNSINNYSHPRVSQKASPSKRKVSAVQTETSTAKKARQRKSFPVTEASRKAELGRQRSSYLSLLNQFMPFKIEMKPAQIYSKPPSIYMRCYLIGLNVDPESSCIRRKDGYKVWFIYSDNTPKKSKAKNKDNSAATATATATGSATAAAEKEKLYYHCEHLNQPALYTLLCKIAASEISFSEFHHHVQKRLSIELLLNTHFHSKNQLLYKNTVGDYKTVSSLIPAPLGATSKPGIPSKITAELTPVRDSKLKIDPSVTAVTQSTSHRGNLSNNNAETAQESEEDSSPSESESELSSASPSLSSRISPANNNNNSNKAVATRSSPAQTKSRKSSRSIDSSPPPIPSPYSSYNFVCIYWRFHNSSENSMSLSVQKLKNFMNQLKAEEPRLATQEISTDIDLEALMNQIEVGVLAALNAPVIKDTKIHKVIAYLPDNAVNHNNSQFKAIPLRIEDICLVLLSREMFDSRVWPLLVYALPMTELTNLSQIEIIPPVKSEANSSKASARTERNQLTYLHKIVSNYVHSICKHPSFLLYGLGANSESTFWAPTSCTPLFALELHASLSKPAVIEWPAYFPFNFAIINHWAQFYLRIHSHTEQRLYLIIPAKQFLVAPYTHYKLSSIQSAFNHANSHSSDANTIKLGKVAINIQPQSSNNTTGNNMTEEKFIVDNENIYLVVEMIMKENISKANSNSNSAHS